MSLVFVSVGFMAFFAATTLAIDVGHVHDRPLAGAELRRRRRRSPARRRSSTTVSTTARAGGPAVQSAINTGKRNKVVGGDVSIEPGDVTFPLGPAGQNDRVQVWVYRTTARGNQIPTLIGPIFGVSDFDIMATATAEAAPANAMTCVKPFTIPDKWIENSRSAVDRPTARSTVTTTRGTSIPNADVYIPSRPVILGILSV